MSATKTTIINSQTVGDYTKAHNVIATLSDGRKAEFVNADFGHEDYPHVGCQVAVFDADVADAGVIVFHSGDVELIARNGEMVIGRGGKIVG